MYFQTKENKISKTFKRFLFLLFTDFSKHVILFDNLVYELKAFSKEGARAENATVSYRRKLRASI